MSCKDIEESDIILYMFICLLFVPLEAEHLRMPHQQYGMHYQNIKRKAVNPSKSYSSHNISR